MKPKVKIESMVLRGAPYQELQPVATVYLDRDEYRVMAPARATGPVADWEEQFTVRVPSEDGRGENPVEDDTAAAVVKIVVDELKREVVEAEFWDWGKHPNARFHYAQICLQGHVISADGRNQIQEGEHCQICGSRCIHRCEKCSAPIRGKRRIVSGQRGVPSYQVPLFCYKCATPYPWMRDRLDTARELLWNDDKLSQEDRERLWDLLQYVMSDPKSDLVPAKRKLIEIKLSSALAATRDALIDLIAKYLAEMSKP